MPVAGLPPITLPKKLGGAARSATPASSVAAGTALTKDNLNRSNTSLSSYRQTRSAPELVRLLAAADGLASTSLLNLLCLADSGYQVRAYETLTQEASHEGQLLAETVISGLDTVWDNSKGYADRRSMAATIETALREVSLTGGVVAELVLDKYRLPEKIVISPYDELIWKSNGKGGTVPYQKPKLGEERSLDYPNIYIAESVKSAMERYSSPTIASGLQALWVYTSFQQDMWQTLRQAGEPRITATLAYEQLVRSAPADVQNDPVKLAAFLEDARASIETLLSGLEPRDSLVVFDQITIDKIETSGEKREFKELLEMLAGQAASALKSNPSLLGLRAGGSQNTASVEAVISTKIARRLQLPVEEVLSKALTLAVRLLGSDSYVEFKFNPIELRPVSELAAHRAMDQARILELLSLGLLTDAEAQMHLGLGSRPTSAPQLSGTGFYKTKPADTMPASGTNAVGRNAGANPDTSAGGSDNEQRV
jgi:hypothetical protein